MYILSVRNKCKCGSTYKLSKKKKEKKGFYCVSKPLFSNLFWATSIKALASSNPVMVIANVPFMNNAGVSYLPPSLKGANEILLPYFPETVCHL